MVLSIERNARLLNGKLSLAGRRWVASTPLLEEELQQLVPMIENMWNVTILITDGYQ